MNWDPFSIRCWANAPGLAHLSLFGADRRDTHGTNAVLLDGRESSLLLSLSENTDWLFENPLLLSWSWSSYLRHVIAINPASGDMVWRQWRIPNERRRLTVPRTVNDACALIETIGKEKAPRGVDVVSHCLAVFKQLRATLWPYGADNRVVILAFNALLEALTEEGQSAHSWETLGHILDASERHEETTVEELHRFRDAAVYDAIDAMTSSPMMGELKLDPYLLMRHASGYVYQEAHFELERARWIQRRLDGSLEPSRSTAGTRQRDARFTPPELARTLVEQALNHFEHLPDSLTVLDPACGSGVFLEEVLRELEQRSFTGHVSLRGYDSSQVSVDMSQFCLRHAAQQCRQAGMIVDVTLQRVDALGAEVDWSRPDVVLMNPPFTRWEDMEDVDKTNVQRVLGELATGRVDKSMAFVWKACQSVCERGVVSTVIPSPMLESTFAQKLRASLADICTLEGIGRLNGYGYFPGAMVEPGFLVLGVRADSNRRRPLIVLVSEPGASSAALRALRRNQPCEAENGNEFFLDVDAERRWLTSASWVPRTLQYARLLDSLSGSVPLVDDLFAVEQGVLTGLNKAFLLSMKALRELAPSQDEQRWFRPVAGSATIRGGRIHEERFVFYPYDESGLLLKTQAEVASAVPQYFNERLRPRQTELSQRRDKQELWWTLNWHRPYQAGHYPRLCTAHFGDAGSFAFDQTGRCIVVQGFLWRWKNAETHAQFLSSDSPLAYTALLNSSVFEILLSCFCPRVQGGQFDLSRRHVKNIFIPDVFAGNVSSDVIDDLHGIGLQMCRGEEYSRMELDNLVARAYGVASEVWEVGGRGTVV